MTISTHQKKLRNWYLNELYHACKGEFWKINIFLSNEINKGQNFTPPKKLKPYSFLI